jgi:hypothetical protein
MGLFDLNRLCEQIFIPVFSVVYGYEDLVNLNHAIPNHPAIDLGDPVRRVGIQITSDPRSSKVQDTLQAFMRAELFKQYDHLIIYVLTAKRASYSSSGWKEITQGRIAFNKDSDIRDHTDLMRDIGNGAPERIHEIARILGVYLGKQPLLEPYPIVRDHLTRQLAKEKRRKRYIPRIFVEVGDVKDRARYFSHPVLFSQRSKNRLSRIHLPEVNRILSKLSLASVVIDGSVVPGEVSTIGDVAQEVERLTSGVSQLHKAVNVYSSYSTPLPDPSLVPEELRYMYKDMKYQLGWTASSVSFELKEILDELQQMSRSVLLIVGRAGQGKTNFVCDLAETFLLRWDIPTLLFTGKDFNHIEPSSIDQFFFRSVFGDRVGSLDEALGILEDLGRNAGAPTLIILDGINEHPSPRSFSYYLENFVERILQYKHIKIILTCRSEYFSERFGNLLESSFSDNTVCIDNFDRHMSNANRERLVQGYLAFYKIDAGFISLAAEEVLQSDTLLLRMFCEAYGDPQAEATIQIAPVVDIYRDRLFRRYLERKIDGAAEYIGGEGAIAVGAKQRFREALALIIERMLEERQFNDVPLSVLIEDYSIEVEVLLGEDLIIRKDLANRSGVLDNSIEVVNFTFDEFRDFLIANHLVEVIYPHDPERFGQTLDQLVSSDSPVSEGVRSYVFHASKLPSGYEIDPTIRKRAWYDAEFTKSIFSVEEELITNGDVTKLQGEFDKSKSNAAWIVGMLIRRWRTLRYPILNIRLLSDIVKRLNDEGLRELVYPVFTGHGVLGIDGMVTVPIEQLSADILSAFEREGFIGDPDLPFLMEALVPLFPLLSREAYTYPAFDIFMKYSQRSPDQAVAILSEYCGAESLGVRSQVWRLLGLLARSREIPFAIVELACAQVVEIQGDEASYPHELLLELARFLDIINSSAGMSFSEEISRYVGRVLHIPRRQ